MAIRGYPVLAATTRVPQLTSAAPSGRLSRRPLLSAASFDHLVGATGQRLRYRQPESLGGLEVDDELDLHRLLDRQIAYGGASFPARCGRPGCGLSRRPDPR